MKRLLVSAVAFVVLCMALASPASALTVAGVDVPESYTAGTTKLTLNGAGTRSKFFMDMYVASLYTPAEQTNARAIISADEPQAITLHIMSGMITSERMVEATEEGFESATNGNTAPLKADIDQFMAVFQSEIKDGDVFDLVYVPGEGVHVLKNGDHQDTVGDLAFKQALFGIWLSDSPAQKNLKKRMLGK